MALFRDGHGQTRLPKGIIYWTEWMLGSPPLTPKSIQNHPPALQKWWAWPDMIEPFGSPPNQAIKQQVAIETIVVEQCLFTNRTTVYIYIY